MSISSDKYAILERVRQNRGFRFRYKPRFLHWDELLTTRQHFGRPEAAIVETVEDYRCSTPRWKTFAFLTESKARADIILWELAAKEDYYSSRTRVVLDSLGDDAGPGKPVIKVSLPVKIRKHGRDELFHAGEVLEGAFFILHEGDIPDEEITVEGAKKALAWSETYWAGIRPFQKAFEIPDPQIMEMLAACGRNILQAREIMVEP